MPPKPKEKGGKKGGKNKKEKKSKYPIIIDGIVTNDMTREELETYIVTIRRELDKERTERNYFQLERDKIHEFWDSTRKQLEDCRLDLRNKDRNLEEAEEKHQLELKIYRQKVKHMMYEHENTEAATKSDKVASLGEAQMKMRLQQSDLRKHNMGLKLQMRKKQIESEEATKALKKDYESEITKLRNDFLEKSKELDQSYQEKMKMQREEMNLRRKSEIHEIEERKNFQIKTLLDNHDESFRAMKNFYNEITLNNINIIKTLKETIDNLRTRLLSTENRLEGTTADLRRKTELCAKFDLVVEDLRRVKGLLDSEKMAHKIARGHVNRLTKENKEVQFENEVLLTSYNLLKSERLEVQKRCEASLLSLQQKTGLRNLILERKLELLKTTNETKDIQLHQIIVASGNLDPVAVSHVTQHIENVMNEKNELIRELQYELVRTEKSHHDLKMVFEKHLSDLNHYQANHGMNLMKSELESEARMGKGPAGLVSVPL